VLASPPQRAAIRAARPPDTPVDVGGNTAGRHHLICYRKDRVTRSPITGGELREVTIKGFSPIDEPLSRRGRRGGRKPSLRFVRGHGDAAAIKYAAAVLANNGNESVFARV
jgi:hypothetical protein